MLHAHVFARTCNPEISPAKQTVRHRNLTIRVYKRFTLEKFIARTKEEATYKFKKSTSNKQCLMRVITNENQN